MTIHENANTVPPTDHLLTRRELADYLAIEQSLLGNYRHPKIGPAGIRVGNLIRYRRSDVDAWVDANAVDPRES